MIPCISDTLYDKTVNLLSANPHILNNPEKYIMDAEVLQIVKGTAYFQDYKAKAESFLARLNPPVQTQVANSFLKLQIV